MLPSLGWGWDLPPVFPSLWFPLIVILLDVSAGFDPPSKSVFPWVFGFLLCVLKAKALSISCWCLPAQICTFLVAVTFQFCAAAAAPSAVPVQAGFSLLDKKHSIRAPSFKQLHYPLMQFQTALLIFRPLPRISWESYGLAK